MGSPGLPALQCLRQISESGSALAWQVLGGLPGILDYDTEVLSLNPTLVDLEISDTRSLLGRAQSGDTDAFCELCRTYETGLLRQAVTLCGNETLAEDLAQDTLVEAWKCLQRYNGGCQFFTWLCAILLNRYRNTLRKKQLLSFFAFTKADNSENPTEQWTDSQAWPDEAAQAREQATLLRKCVQALPPKQQQVIHLRFFVDDSLEGIAAALGCSVGTVKSRLFHALDRLRGMKELSASSPLPPKGGDPRTGTPLSDNLRIFK